MDVISFRAVAEIAARFEIVQIRSPRDGRLGEQERGEEDQFGLHIY